MMFKNYNNYFRKKIEKLIKNKILSHFLMIFMLISFMLYRVPSTFDVFYFSNTLIMVLLPYFMSLVSSRLVSDWEEFFASFTPVGAPLGMAPFVSMAEGMSYVVRPFVLMLRPFLNLTMGAFGALSMGGYMSYSFSPFVFILFSLLFFYEMFVSLVHWFMVSNMLMFSMDH